MQLGTAIRGEWDLDPDYLTVNHGSYGAAPRVVREAQDAWRARMEAQPTRFMARILPDALREAADGLARAIGARGTDLVFVDNATTGCNAVLASLDLQPGDEILMLDHVYGAVRNAARHFAGRSGARLVEVAVPFPLVDDDALLQGLTEALGKRVRLAVIDHVTSPSALVLPVRRIIAACHEAGVPVLIDGAHAPGMLDLDLTALDADWYSGNCHKWLMAPKGCAFLLAREDRHAGLHPTVISHGYGRGFLAEFDWTGTRDPSAWLAITEALAFHARLGGAALRRRNASLAAEAAALLADRLGTETPRLSNATSAMALVRLNASGPADAIRSRLLDAGTDAPVHTLGGAPWIRISVQAYNELGDFEQLAALIDRALPGPAKG